MEKTKATYWFRKILFEETSAPEKYVRLTHNTLIATDWGLPNGCHGDHGPPESLEDPTWKSVAEITLFHSVLLLTVQKEHRLTDWLPLLHCINL